MPKKCDLQSAAINLGKTTVSVLHDAQLLLNKQQLIWGGIYIH